jgi:hypothetical protein
VLQPCFVPLSLPAQRAFVLLEGSGECHTEVERNAMTWGFIAPPHPAPSLSKPSLPGLDSEAARSR